MADHRGVRRQRNLDEVRVALAEGKESNEIADADRFFDEGREHSWCRDSNVNTPRLIEHPLVLRMINASDDARDAVLGLREKRDYEVDLVIARRSNDNLAISKSGFIEGRNLAGICGDECGAFDPTTSGE
jgi:hypothetical protein